MRLSVGDASAGCLPRSATCWAASPESPLTWRWSGEAEQSFSIGTARDRQLGPDSAASGPAAVSVPTRAGGPCRRTERLFAPITTERSTAPPRALGSSLPPILQLREQPKHLEVQPDERHQQAERAVPLHVLRRAAGRALFDEIEVEHEVHRRDADHE